MRIPHTTRKKALVIVDVQKNFISEVNEHIITSIAHLIDTVPYDVYVSATFDVGKDSLWAQQQNWYMPDDGESELVAPLAKQLEDRTAVHIKKSTRSAFKGTPELVEKLRENGIEEIHIVGTATHDCVMATAFDAFDLGFPVYVLEECCGAMSHPERHDMGIQLLQYQNMTNNSCLAETIDVA